MTAQVWIGTAAQRAVYYDEARQGEHYWLCFKWHGILTEASVII